MRKLSFIALAALALSAWAPALAQQQLPRPGQGGAPVPPGAAQQQRPPTPQQPPRPGQPGQQDAPAIAPPRPYQAVAVKPPQPSSDAALAAFRKQIGEIAERKDRAALARHVVAQGFFWLKPPDGRDGADKKKLGIDNLAAALRLNARDGSGWDLLAELAGDETAMPFPNRAGVVCSPADPQFNPAELEAVAKATGTGPGDWGYALAESVEVRAQPQPGARVIDKLGLHFVRVLPDERQDQNRAPAGEEESAFLRVVTPSGKIGYVAEESLSPLPANQLCFSKDASGAWKIAGLLGGPD